MRIPCFGHAGDGNIHVNIMVDKDDREAIVRAHEAEEVLFAGVRVKSIEAASDAGLSAARAGSTRGPSARSEISLGAG